MAQLFGIFARVFPSLCVMDAHARRSCKLKYIIVRYKQLAHLTITVHI